MRLNLRNLNTNNFQNHFLPMMLYNWFFSSLQCSNPWAGFAISAHCKMWTILRLWIWASQCTQTSCDKNVMAGTMIGFVYSKQLIS